MRLSQMPEIYRPQVATEPKCSLWEEGITEKQRGAVAVEAASFKGAHEAHVQHVTGTVKKTAIVYRIRTAARKAAS